ncbi:MAG: AMP-binding protein, partial [Pirellulaceae bacterium]
MNQVNLASFFAPYVPTTTNLVDCLRYWAEVKPNGISFRFTDGEGEDTAWNYRELERRARAIAAVLQSQQMRGERVILLYPPGLDFVAGFFGCLFAGAVAVPAFPPRRNRYMDRIDAIACDADARVALTIRDVSERVDGLLDDSPHLQRLEWIATDTVPVELAEQWVPAPLTSDTLAVLQYTSGSTGTPKGVMLTHGNLLHNATLITYSFEPSRQGVGMTWLPTYHDMGLVGGVIKPVFYGRPNVLMSPMAFLQ